MKKWFAVLLPALLLALFASGCKKAAEMITREKGMEISCVTNLKQIGIGILMYKDDHDKLPATNGWEEAILQYVGDERAMKCPKDHSHYRYFGNGQEVGSLESPSSMIVVICECEHRKKTTVCFVDGHVATADSKKVKQAIEKANSGQLPVLLLP